MGQENEIKDAQSFLDDLILHEEELKKENNILNISSYSFEIAKRIAKSYLAYEKINEHNQIMKVYKNHQISIIEDNKAIKLNEINEDFKILIEWINMVIIPNKIGLKSFSNEIVNEEQKVENNNKKNKL